MDEKEDVWAKNLFFAQIQEIPGPSPDAGIWRKAHQPNQAGEGD